MYFIYNNFIHLLNQQFSYSTIFPWSQNDFHVIQLESCKTLKSIPALNTYIYMLKIHVLEHVEADTMLRKAIWHLLWSMFRNEPSFINHFTNTALCSQSGCFWFIMTNSFVHAGIFFVW